ncbi:hypothetical protein RRG08_017061 [Elysia crispata]|uniref:Uncharacterized protein n=1 Tax=Elysia crispata TaxID=231223 RepID=A0AAE1DDA0_9GAST|nr:hypothetical protein RRG08_017061 [Elysia crispata]
MHQVTPGRIRAHSPHGGGKDRGKDGGRTDLRPNTAPRAQFVQLCDKNFQQTSGQTPRQELSVSSFVTNYPSTPTPNISPRAEHV